VCVCVCVFVRKREGGRELRIGECVMFQLKPIIIIILNFLTITMLFIISF
jgi:hypothetical protein